MPDPAAIRPAAAEDAAAVTACVCAAYLRYIERIGYFAFDYRTVDGYPRVFMRKELP